MWDFYFIQGPPWIPICTFWTYLDEITGSDSNLHQEGFHGITLVTLQLDDLTILCMLHHSAVAVELLPQKHTHTNVFFSCKLNKENLLTDHPGAQSAEQYKHNRTHTCTLR